MSNLNYPKVLVDGATGYVGSHLVHLLIKRGFQVNCLVHKKAKQDDIAFLQSVGTDAGGTDAGGTGAKIFQYDLNDQTAERAFAGMDCAVHLIGSIAPPRGTKLDDLHTEQTKCFAEHAAAAGIKKIIAVTALGTSPHAASTYHQTKSKAEAVISQSGIDFVILRPSLIVGKQVGKRDSKLVRRLQDMIQAKKIIPLISGGKNQIQPIFIADLAEAICAAIEDDQLLGKTCELGGEEIVTMRQLVEELMQILEVKKPILPLPRLLAYTIAGFCELKEGVPMVSRDQVTLSQLDNICHDNALTSLLKIKPTPLRHALTTYKLGDKSSQAIISR